MHAAVRGSRFGQTLLGSKGSWPARSSPAVCGSCRTGRGPERKASGSDFPPSPAQFLDDNLPVVPQASTKRKSATLARYYKDELRFPPYTYAEEYCVFPDSVALP